MLDKSKIIKGVERILILGAGGGSIATELQYHHPGKHITIVDIEQDALKLTQYLLGYHKNIDYIEKDAKIFIQECSSELFDIIICDIADIHNGSIPPWTTSMEFLTDVKRCLNISGIYMFNDIGFNDFFRETIRYWNKIYDVFENIETIEHIGYPLKNIVYIGDAAKPERS